MYVVVDPKQPAHSLCSLSAGFDFIGYSGDTRQVGDAGNFDHPQPPRRGCSTLERQNY